MKLCLLPIFLLLCTSIAFAQNKCDSIVWKPSRKLTWSDYMAQAPLKATRAAALTHFDFTRTWSTDGGKLKTLLVCSFDPCKSWSRNKKSDTLLLHEQGHFDIAEYFKRLYYQRVAHASYTPATIQAMLNKIYYDINTECAAMEEAYDMETVHSLNRKAQFEWLDKIAALLAQMESYNKEELIVDLH